MKKTVISFVLWAMVASAAAQVKVDIILSKGHVIDPATKTDAVRDIAIRDGVIVKIAPDLSGWKAAKVIAAKGLLVTPGLIDLHTHFFWGSHMDQAYMDGPNALQPDGFTFRNGVTTAVDAGSSGWKTFPLFKKQTIDNAQTRILAFLNIVGEGMRGGKYEQDTADMDARDAAAVAAANPQDIVGFKVAHYEGHNWVPVDHAVAASGMVGDTLPVMVDFGGTTPYLPLRELFFDHMRPADIFTHCYAQLGETRESIVDTVSGKIPQYVWEARKRGIIFDVGYGGISFAFSQAIPAMQQHFYPNSISTDLHRESMNAAMKDILTTMDKFLAMGMPLNEVIAAVTVNPAREIRHPELGILKEGGCADIALLELEKGDFRLFDYKGIRLSTDKKLVCKMTIRNGKIVYDLDGLAYASPN
ncbi:MAG: amidohydrolase/deacetylase family metallohydrolase [Chitinophagaceae bacterium]